MTKEKTTIKVVEKDEPDGITCFYLIIYKTTKDSKIEVSRRFLTRENAINNPLYTDSELKRIVRLEASDAWLKRI